jgi:redox-sensitive bicupin YhaK (pirin superfamily)
MAPPHFSMLWREAIPTLTLADEAGRTTQVTVIAGKLAEANPPAPPPKSWAARADSDVAIWSITMAPGATWTLPPANAGQQPHALRVRGQGLAIGAREVAGGSAVRLKGDASAVLTNGSAVSELLLLQGRPIGEPVVAARAVRDEHPRGDPAGVQRLSAHALRRLAVAERRAGAPARGGSVRDPRGWSQRASVIATRRP